MQAEIDAGEEASRVVAPSGGGYCYIVYFDKVREGVYYGFIRGRKKEYVHFNLLYVQSLTRVPEPCA